MTEERRKQIRRDMDSYLSQRKKGGWTLFKKSDPQPILHPAVQPYKKEEPNVEKLEQPMEQEYESQKKGWFSGFMDKLFGEETVEATEQVAAPVDTDAAADLKELARISLQVMKTMPGELIRDFKETADYEKFKTILRKHRLIK